MFTLAIDLGSTNLKGAVFADQGTRLADVSLPLSYSAWEKGKVELDPEQVWDQLVDLMLKLSSEASIRPDKIERLTITSQAQTFLLTDHYGSPISPLISWIDTRATSLVEELGWLLGQEFHRHCSFPQVLPELMLAKVAWIKKNYPELIEQSAWILPFPSWFTMNFGLQPSIDHNIAAMSGLYSLKDQDWWDQALNYCGIDKRKMPNLIKGKVSCKEIDLQKKTPFSLKSIFFAGNDQTCGAVASQLAEKDLLLTLGTTLVAYRLAGSFPGPFHTRSCWGPYPLGGYYELAALSPSSSQFQPILTRSSDNNQMAENMDVYECLLIRSFELYDMIIDELEWTKSQGKVYVAGGGSQNDQWLQILADILNTPVQKVSADALHGAFIQSNNRSLAMSTTQSEISFYPIVTTGKTIRKKYLDWKNTKLNHR